ncbi:MAG: cbb3-type cytochrome c oxidase subunit I [Planctomycetes bacterium]|nr:cbb3-type cytochrome c oxidase subunit I [Planctomycetota bacterium]MCL4729895.1 cbb3-type cytochrome c oxidase subunit I [Planctomycetota bacterium]
MAPEVPTTGRQAGPREIALADARRWFTLGVLSLLIAGTIALVLVVGRIPGLSHLIDTAAAKRSLVVHVNLALGVWFFSSTAGLFCLLPGARRPSLSLPAWCVATAGMILFSLAMFFADAEPVLSNYVPALDHGLFLGGLAVFAGGVCLQFADRRLVAPGASPLLPPGAVAGMRCAAVVFVLSLATVFAAWATQADGLTQWQYFERLFWGGGHLLQFVNVLSMASAWLLLLSRVLGRVPVAPKLAAGLMLLLAAPALAGPWLAARDDGMGLFTELMRWGIFPAVVVLLAACGRALWQARGSLAPGALTTPAFTGFATAACMTILGFLLGAGISAETTLVPAHYHVSIGAVTATYMATILALQPDYGRPARLRRVAAWQPVVFGIGQTIFGAGFAIAGVAGAERKKYGAEQIVRSTGEWAGLSVMGAGGLVALCGGVLFLAVLVAGRRAQRRAGVTA